MKLRDEDIFITTAFYTESGVTHGVIIVKHLPTGTSISIESGSFDEIIETLTENVENKVSKKSCITSSLSG